MHICMHICMHDFHAYLHAAAPSACQHPWGVLVLRSSPSSSVSFAHEHSNSAQDARLAAALEALPQLSSLTLAACADITDRSLQVRAEMRCLSMPTLQQDSQEATR